MSFTNAPVSRLLVTGVVCSSLLASLLDTKHYLYIRTDLHLWQYGQFWRLVLFQLAWTNSSEVLFGAMAFYHLRIIERLWGSRKYASFLLISFLLTCLVVPTFFIVLAPLTGGVMSYVPAGPVPLLFAAYAQYKALVPHLYQYQLVFRTPFALPTKTPSASSPESPAPSAPNTSTSISTSTKITLTDRLPTHFLILQSVLFQFPSSLPGALTGFAIGQAFRNDMLPSRLAKWRVPNWLVGSSASLRRGRNEGFEDLQRRLEGEGVAAGISTGILAPQRQQNGEGRRRGWLDTVRGAF